MPFSVVKYLPPLKRPLGAAISDLMPLACLDLPDAEEAASFYEAAFGAYEFCFEQVFKKLPFTKELSINGHCVLINEDPDWTYPPSHIPAACLKVENVDAAMARAVFVGAYLLDKVVFYPKVNWRVGRVTDPFGYVWTIYEELQEQLKHCGGGLRVLLS